MSEYFEIDVEKRLVKYGEKKKHLKFPDGYDYIKNGRLRIDDLMFEFSFIGMAASWEHPDEEDCGFEFPEDFEPYCVLRKQ